MLQTLFFKIHTRIYNYLYASLSINKFMEVNMIQFLRHSIVIMFLNKVELISLASEKLK